MIYLDEIACNEHTADRRYAWAPVGAKVISSIPAIRSEQYSILPAYTIDGYLAWQAYQGSYNAEQFVEFVRDELLPLCNPFPGRNSDNASIHHSIVSLISMLLLQFFF